MSIIARNLTYVYNKKSPFEKKALSDINLHIKEGEIFGIIGHTGSGKSTLVQHFNALIKLQIGELKVAGHDLNADKVNYKALRGDVGMVFQYPEYQLFADTVEKDVMFGLKNFNEREKLKKGEVDNRAPELTEDDMKARVRRAIELVGLDYYAVKDKSPFDLSGGQKRRVAIAGVIVTSPKILILDEPSAGLDPRGKEEIMNLIHALHESSIKTVVIISHDMDEIATHADRIAVLADGKVQYVLPPKQLFTKSDNLVELGLDVPIAVKIAAMLKERGFKIEADAVDIDELADNIYKGVAAKC